MHRGTIAAVIRRTRLTASSALPLRSLAPVACFSSSSRLLSPPSSARPRFRLTNAQLFGALTLFGLGATAVGLYDFYSSFTTYPAPVRAHLRAALRLASVDPVRSSSEFAAAYELALQTPSLSLRETSGVPIRWGAMWEAAGNRDAARESYLIALDEIRARISLGQVEDADVKRAVGVSLKIGDLWAEQGKDARAEPYYEWGLQELLRLGMSEKQKGQLKEALEGTAGPGPAVEEKEPAWVGDVEVVGAMERLGQLYARMGNAEYAQPLLLQAISTLLPPPSKTGPSPPPPPIESRCHAATLMNNLSSTFIPPSGKPSPEATDSASRWARQALTVAQDNKKHENEECAMTAAVASFNLGKLSEIAGDEKSARAWFVKSGKQSARIGFVDGVRESRLALQRLPS